MEAPNLSTAASAQNSATTVPAPNSNINATPNSATTAAAPNCTTTAAPNSVTTSAPNSNLSTVAAAQNSATTAAPKSNLSSAAGTQKSAEGLDLILAAGRKDGSEEVQRLLRLDFKGDHYPKESHSKEAHELLKFSTEVEGFTALHVVAIAGHYEVVGHILRAIWSLWISEGEMTGLLHRKDCIGRTPLHHAAWMQHADVMHKILRWHWEVDVNAQDNDKFTPVHFLLMNWKGNPHVVRPLLTHPHTNLGGEATQSEKTRNDLILKQQQLSQDQCWRKDLSRKIKFPEMSSYVLPESWRRSIIPVQEIVPRDLDLVNSQKDSDSLARLKTACRVAKEGVHEQIVEEIRKVLIPIVESKFKKKPDMSTFNVIHLVAFLGLSGVMEILAQNSKLFVRTINETNCDMQTPLHLASLAGKVDIVERLNKESELRGSVEDNDGQTAVHIAFEKGHDNIVAILMLREDVKDYVSFQHADRSVYVDGTNAILVGASLIASITFGGWLSPPLGYQQYYQFPISDASSPAYEQYAAVADDISLKVFWISNSLSFYFAIAAILAGAAAVVPRSWVFVKAEVKRLGGALFLTSLAFSLAIMFAVVAFTAAGFASLPPIVRYQRYMVFTVMVGLFACFSTFIIARTSNPMDYVDYFKHLDPGRSVAIYTKVRDTIHRNFTRYKQRRRRECLSRRILGRNCDGNLFGFYTS